MIRHFFLRTLVAVKFISQKMSRSDVSEFFVLMKEENHIIRVIRWISKFWIICAIITEILIFSFTMLLQCLLSIEQCRVFWKIDYFSHLRNYGFLFWGMICPFKIVEILVSVGGSSTNDHTAKLTLEATRRRQWTIRSTGWTRVSKMRGPCALVNLFHGLRTLAPVKNHDGLEGRWRRKGPTSR